jgi:hypothetical protein
MVGQLPLGLPLRLPMSSARTGDPPYQASYSREPQACPGGNIDDGAGFFEANFGARRCLQIAVQLAAAHRATRDMVSAAGLTNFATL